MDYTEIIKTLITVGIPAIVTILSTHKIKTQANKHACRQSILQLILEDKVAYMERKLPGRTGRLPENKQAIMDEYDEYKVSGGNHYIDEKVEEYLKWHKEVTEELMKNAR